MKCVNSGCEWRNRHFLHCHERPLIANKGAGETDETDIVTAADTRQEWKQSFQGRQGMFLCNLGRDLKICVPARVRRTVPFYADIGEGSQTCRKIRSLRRRFSSLQT